MRELRQSDEDAKQQSEGDGITPPLPRPRVPVRVTTVPATGIRNTRSLAAALPSPEPPPSPGLLAAKGPGLPVVQHAPGTLPGGSTGHVHPQCLPSHRKGASVSKAPGMSLACCHRPAQPISLYHLLCLEIPLHLPAAYGQQSSRATRSCVTTVQLPNQPRQKGKGGPEYGAAALANILLSSGTEQTVAGYGANLLQERIFNIPPLQE